MQIQVNGQTRPIHEGVTVADLLKELDVRSEHVAVEVNLQILDRQDFSRRMLQSGDRVEIISFIGGGMGGEGMRGSACSQGAHDKNVLARCAQRRPPHPLF